MNSIHRVGWLLCVVGMALVAGRTSAEDPDRLKVGLQADGSIVLPTNQVLRPAGRQLNFPGRPVDCAVTDGGQTLVVKNLRELLFIDAVAGRIRQTLALPRPAKKEDELFFSVVG